VQIRIRHLPFQLAEAALDLFDQLIDHAPIVAHRPGPDTSLPRPHRRAGANASTLFGIGLLGAGVLAAAVVPLSTAYSVAETAGRPAEIDDTFREAPLFYLGTRGLIVTGVALALIAASVIALRVLTIAG
jgi:hypothetical protein